MEEQVTISKKEYNDLLDNQKKFNALLAAGVDNWEGYSYAIDIYNGEMEK